MRRLTETAGSRNELKAQVQRKHGPLARIEKVDEVRSQGVGGWFQSISYVATVLVPDPGDERAPILNSSALDQERTRILIDEPTPSIGHDDGGEAGMDLARFAPQVRPVVPLVHIPSPDADTSHLVKEAEALTAKVERETAARLSVFVGLLNDPVGCAPNAKRAGSLDPYVTPTFGTVAYGLGDGADVSRWATKLASLRPDEVVAVVDVGRKVEDTAMWLSQLAAHVKIAYLVPSKTSTHTLTPGTIHQLGYEVREA